MRGVLGQLGSSSSEAVKICRLGLGHGSVEAADAFTLFGLAISTADAFTS